MARRDIRARKAARESLDELTRAIRIRLEDAGSPEDELRSVNNLLLQDGDLQFALRCYFELAVEYKVRVPATWVDVVKQFHHDDYLGEPDIVYFTERVRVEISTADTRTDTERLASARERLGALEGRRRQIASNEIQVTGLEWAALESAIGELHSILD